MIHERFLNDALASQLVIKTLYQTPALWLVFVDARGVPRQHYLMTPTNSFIAELVVNANRIHLLDGYQKRRMLERAVATVRDLRETIGMPVGPGRDCLLDIHTIALSVERGWQSDHDVREAFLQAAGMIRDLHIIVASKTEISFVETA